jgi:hypothetical protein
LSVIHRDIDTPAFGVYMITPLNFTQSSAKSSGTILDPSIWRSAIINIRLEVMRVVKSRIIAWRLCSLTSLFCFFSLHSHSSSYIAHTKKDTSQKENECLTTKNLETMKDLRKCEFELNGEFVDGFFHKWESEAAIVEDKKGRCHLVEMNEVRFTDFLRDTVDKVQGR